MPIIQTRDKESEGILSVEKQKITKGVYVKKKKKGKLSPFLLCLLALSTSIAIERKKVSRGR